MLINLYIFLEDKDISILPTSLRYYKDRIPGVNIIVCHNGVNTIEGIVEEFKVRAVQYKGDYLDFLNNCWKHSGAALIILVKPREFINISKDILLNCSIIRAIGYQVEDLNSLQNKERDYRYDKICIFDPTVIKEMNFEEDGLLCSPLGFIRFGELRPELYYIKENDNNSSTGI